MRFLQFYLSVVQLGFSFPLSFFKFHRALIFVLYYFLRSEILILWSQYLLVTLWRYYWSFKVFFSLRILLWLSSCLILTCFGLFHVGAYLRCLVIPECLIIAESEALIGWLEVWVCLSVWGGYGVNCVDIRGPWRQCLSFGLVRFSREDHVTIFLQGTSLADSFLGTMGKEGWGSGSWLNVYWSPYFLWSSLILSCLPVC